MKSLHKAVYVDIWLLGSPLSLYFSNQGISMFCDIGFFNISSENGFLLTYCNCCQFWFWFKVDICCWSEVTFCKIWLMIESLLDMFWECGECGGSVYVLGGLLCYKIMRGDGTWGITCEGPKP